MYEGAGPGRQLPVRPATSSSAAAYGSSSPATIRTIPSTGDLLLVWNKNYQQGTSHAGKRTPLTAAISSDQGKTWQHVRQLETGPDHGYAYTSILFHKDRVLLSYYVHDSKSGRISCRFRSLPVRWFYEN